MMLDTTGLVDAVARQQVTAHTYSQPAATVVGSETGCRIGEG